MHSCTQVDVVYIGTVSACHKDTVLMMFDAGKPVLCEKPLTTSPEDTATLIKAAKEKGVFFMEVSIGFTRLHESTSLLYVSYLYCY